jgi:hypothetical protein
VAAVSVVLGHNVEQEWLHIIVEGFGTQEKLGQEAKILTINWVLSAVDLEERVFAVAVYLVPRRMLGGTFQLLFTSASS